MLTIICGEIDRDDVMEWCQVHGKFTQHDQYLAGYNCVLDTHICKTNIEPFFNGVRAAVKHGKISSKDVEFVFHSTAKPYISHPVIDEEGRIDNWPIGFFDEETRALLELL